MNTKEHKKYQEDFSKFVKTLLESKEKTEKFLVRSGIHDKEGTLNKPYITSS